MLRSQIKNSIARAADLPADVAFSLEAPPKPEYGDFATNLPMMLAKREGKNPMEIARRLAESVSDPLIKTIKPASPGFLNIALSDSALKHNLEEILRNPAAFGNGERGRGKTAIVEYFQLNVGKPSHVGHLRSAVIGDALKRILDSQGYETVSDTHIGDWGTQFGILIQAFKRNKNLLARPSLTLSSETFGVAEDASKWLQRLYVEENQLIEKDPSVRETAKEEFARLERGDPQNRMIWEWFVSETKNEMQRVIERLRLERFDVEMGESAYETMMPPIVEDALEKGVAKKNEDGAVTVDLSAEDLDEAVLVKSDGASTYLLRDLATIKYRKERFNFWRNFYVVDNRQAHHFRQVFRVAKLLGCEGAEESRHVEFGFMKLPEGMISTRAGNVISLTSVMDEAEARAAKVIEEKNPGLQDKAGVAKMVGIGALKYFDLSHNRTSDIVFRWEDALAFEGNSGPYLQYTHARLRSILRKTGRASGVDEIPADSLERKLAVDLTRFPDALEDAAEALMPHMLAQYLFSLAQDANNFYHSHPVFQEEDAIRKRFRIALVTAIAGVLKRGLGLLGVEAPEEM